MHRVIATSVLTAAFLVGCAAADPARAETARAEPASETATLVMVEQPGCIYCAMWDEAIAPIYPETPEGAFAPLLRADLREGPPDGMSYARKVTFTPTFILVVDGQEQARIEGYPGEDFFWGMLGKILDEHTDFEAKDS